MDPYHINWIPGSQVQPLSPILPILIESSIEPKEPTIDPPLENVGIDPMGMAYIRESSMVIRRSLDHEKIPIEIRRGNYEYIFDTNSVIVKVGIANLEPHFKLPDLLQNILDKITTLCVSGNLVYEDSNYHLTYFVGKTLYLSTEDFFYCESKYGNFILILNIIDTTMVLNCISMNTISSVSQNQTSVTIKYYNRHKTFPNYYEYNLLYQDDIFITNPDKICIPNQLVTMTVIDNEIDPESSPIHHLTPRSPRPLTPHPLSPSTPESNAELIPEPIQPKLFKVFMGILEEVTPYSIMVITDDILYDIQTQRSYRYINKEWQRIENVNYIFKSDLNKFVFFQDRTKTIIILPIEIPYYLFIRDSHFCHNRNMETLQCISYEFDDKTSKITKDNIINPNGEIIDLIHNGSNTFLLKQHIYANFYIHKIPPPKRSTPSSGCCTLL